MDLYGKFFSIIQNDKKKTPKQLETVLETRFKTTFIGSLDILEKNLGFLWGQGKSFDELTPQEKEWLKIREEIRKSVLDNGNNQLRAMKTELEKYIILSNQSN